MKLLLPLLFISFLLLAVALAEPLQSQIHQPQSQIHQPQQSHSLTGNQQQKSQQESLEESEGRQKRQFWGFPGMGWGGMGMGGWGWGGPWRRYGGWGWGR